METEVRILQEKLMARSVRRSGKVARLKSAIGSTQNFQCLEISEGDGTISAQLRTLGGSWKTIVPTREAFDSVSYSLNENIGLLKDEKLPFEDNSFDRLIVVGGLKFFSDDYEFIHECHRVLKNDGWVVVAESRRFPTSLTALIQRLSGNRPVNRGAKRNGYKGHELFDKLKDGFDVPETIVYSNGMSECMTAFGEWVQKLFIPVPDWLVPESVSQADLKNYQRVLSMAGFAYPLMWLLSKLEFIPGHQLIVRSRRRHWRPRLQPKLIDGRSIAEAAINTKIGTAAPF